MFSYWVQCPCHDHSKLFTKPPQFIPYGLVKKLSTSHSSLIVAYFEKLPATILNALHSIWKYVQTVPLRSSKKQTKPVFVQEVQALPYTKGYELKTVFSQSTWFVPYSPESLLSLPPHLTQLHFLLTVSSLSPHYIPLSPLSTPTLSSLYPHYLLSLPQLSPLLLLTLSPLFIFSFPKLSLLPSGSKCPN